MTQTLLQTQRAYQEHRVFSSEIIHARKHAYHLMHWGDDASKPLVLLCHGWMDVGASFQFLVDAFEPEFFEAHHFVAIDWRGYGKSSRTLEDSYWFADYIGDLDAIVNHLSPEKPITLLGHSMGGNVVMMYAGIRPERISHLINLEGFGMPAAAPEQAPARYVRWLDAIKAGETMNSYNSLDAVATRLMKNNPRLQQARADWLAAHWAEETSPGVFEICGDPAHKLPTPLGYRVEEVLACWQQITAPVLVVEGSQTQLTQWWQQRYTLAEFHERLKVLKQYELHTLAGAGHMLHHEQPEALARLIEAHCT
jgi:pimeloyl-ACP methyl ester carboxylesterase